MNSFRNTEKFNMLKTDLNEYKRETQKMFDQEMDEFRTEVRTQLREFGLMVQENTDDRDLLMSEHGKLIKSFELKTDLAMKTIKTIKKSSRAELNLQELPDFCKIESPTAGTRRG